MPCAEQSFTKIAKTQFEKFSGFQIYVIIYAKTISKLYTLLCDFGAFSSPEPVVSWSRGRETSGSGDENGFWWNSVQRKALMRTMCSREIFTKKCRQQQIFESDLKWAWHYNHVTFNPIAKHFTLYCRLIYMLSTLCVRLTIKVKVEIPESCKVGWYPP